MKIQTFSVVVGGSACNAQCPYCVSKLTGCKRGLIENQKAMDINKRNFNIACNFAKQSGVTTVLFTGKGEPMLFHHHISRYIEMLEKWNFPFIELQTNGILLPDTSEYLLRDWYDGGLTTVCLSCASYSEKENKEIFGQKVNLQEQNYLQQIFYLLILSQQKMLEVELELYIVFLIPIVEYKLETM